MPIYSVNLSTLYLTWFLFLCFVFTSVAVWYFTLHIPWYLISFSGKTTLLKQTENIWSSYHSIHFLVICPKFIDSALENSCFFSLKRFLAWLQNKQTFIKALVLVTFSRILQLTSKFMLKLYVLLNFERCFHKIFLLVFLIFLLFHVVLSQCPQIFHNMSYGTPWLTIYWLVPWHQNTLNFGFAFLSRYFDTFSKNCYWTEK